MEKFSVLMSVYAREKPAFFREALRSVFEQSVPPDEVVVVKDGPLGDELDRVIEEFDVKVVALPENVGSGVARNEGLKRCSNELVAIMDSDDISKNDRFEKQLKAFEQNPQASVISSWLDEFIDDKNNIITQKRLPETAAELLKYSKSRNPINQPAVMFKKTAVETVGGYQDFYLFEDYYLWIRLIDKGYNLYNIQESLVYFRANPQMLARRGGWKYAVSEMRFFIAIKKMGVIGVGAMLKNIIIRFPIRILPNKIRTFVYQKLLR